MATSSVPSTASAKSITSGNKQRLHSVIAPTNAAQFSGKDTSRTLHRSIPPIHELTSYNIGYKPKSNLVRYRKSAPVPTNMTYLPSAEEKLLLSRKLLAKVVGLDSTVFDRSLKSDKLIHRSHSRTLTEENTLSSPRYSNAFPSAHSPRGLRLSREYDLFQSEIVKGHGLPATPRLLRRGDSKNYGVRRQISASNQLELSPDFSPESRKSPIHFNTPAAGEIMTPAEDEKAITHIKNEEKQEELIESRESQHISNLVSPFGPDDLEETKTALTNSLVLRDRNKDVPWVYCFKVKRDRLKLSELLTSKSATDPAIDKLLPAF